jgi:hypothetical protein
MQATVSTPKGEKLSLGGFMVVSRDKLRALSGETLQQLVKSDELELLYLHLASMRNFNDRQGPPDRDPRRRAASRPTPRDSALPIRPSILPR